ncbi:MAG: T9SS type A sorting domain-containing protein, partial [Bacteroidetes bacterium]|nr:T9SS type A sorting domain-containing protein [Bacteroidota bacterium]
AGPTTGTGFLLEGSIAEIAMYDVEVTVAQRIIVTNYLAAKYDITLSANDVYDMDDNANGDFDFEMAGIGQASDGSNHLDAQGSGIVRMWNPSALGNSEFLLWGHDNATLTVTTTAVGTDVDGTVIEERLTRIWRLAETGDVGTVSVSFDISPFNSPLGSNLRLLIDRDGDGFADNDVTPISGSSVGNTVVFSGVDFQDGDRFTLGNTDLPNPLPVELLSFDAISRSNDILLKWTTATETNNDFFTMERSIDAFTWNIIGNVAGAGNSDVELTYQLIDEQPLDGLNYYRLKQIDFDGTFEYSQVISAQFGIQELLIYPNPASNSVTITSGRNVQWKYFRMSDMLGNNIPVKYDKISEVQTTVDFEEIASGIYFFHIPVEGISVIKRIIVN